MVDKRQLKVTQDFRDFLENFATNRVIVGTDRRTGNLCDLPDIIVKYFKLNNDRYKELVKLGGGKQNGI